MCSLNNNAFISEESSRTWLLQSTSKILVFQCSGYVSYMVLCKCVSESLQTKQILNLHTFRWKIFFIDQVLVPDPYYSPIFLISNDQFHMVSRYAINHLLFQCYTTGSMFDRTIQWNKGQIFVNQYSVQYYPEQLSINSDIKGKNIAIISIKLFPSRPDFHKTLLNSYQNKDMYQLRQIGKLSPRQIQMQTQKAIVRYS